MLRRSAWVLLAVAACSRPTATGSAEPETEAESSPAPAAKAKPPADPNSVQCPDGAVVRGAPPPEGLRVWCELADGREHGPMKSWHDRRQVKTAGAYFEGRPHGQWQSWDPRGALRSQGQYERGTMVGTWTTFYANGQRATEIRYDGDKAGYQSWHANGGQHRKGQYLGGEETGAWTEWDETGNVVAQTQGNYVVDADSIGVPECDTYLKAYLECVDQKMPKSIRKQARRAIDDGAKAWRKHAKTPDGRKALAETCKVAHATMLRSMESLGCG